MENNIEILNELKELSPLIAGMEKLNVFTVPEGYFETLSDDILTGIAIENGTVAGRLSGSFSADVPVGYFDALADNILNRIRSQKEESAPDELRVLSPMLYSIQNENVFEVPRGYFDSLSDTILAQVIPQQTKVVIMRSRTFIKYAVAAAFTGVMALGVFQFINNDKQNDDPIVAQGIQIARENKFDEELAKIPDEDIVKFLEAGGSDVKTALVANSIDENELPSQEEYLSDDKALDKYLNSINLNDLNN